MPPLAELSPRKYTYKGNSYELLYEALMKVGEQWIESIVYQSSFGTRYVRNKKDFNEKFKLIK